MAWASSAPILFALVFGVSEPDAVRAALQRVLADPAYQRAWAEQAPAEVPAPDGGGQDAGAGPPSEAWGTTWPEGRRPPSGRPGGADGAGRGPVPTAPSASPSAPRRSGRAVDAADFVRLVVLVLGLAVLLLAAAALWRRRTGRARPARSAAPPTRPEAAPEALAAPLDEAQRLAAEGRHAEAIHVLLLRSLAALARHQRLDPALTSREIVAGVAMPQAARSALRDLVRSVEHSLFGGRTVDAAGWERCRLLHDALRAALAAPGLAS